MIDSLKYLFLFSAGSCLHHCRAVELQFDDPAAGFFLRSVDLTAGSNAAAAGVIVPAEAAAAAVPSSEPSVDDNDDLE